MNGRPLIMFDGVCNFCNYWVNFAMKRDRRGKLRFTTLQGDTAKTVLPTYKLNPDAITSVILIENGKAYTQSSAVFRICRHLNGAWKMAYIFIFIPKFLRDLVYNWIAKNRYRWFGKREVCRIPTPQERERFLD